MFSKRYVLKKICSQKDMFSTDMFSTDLKMYNSLIGASNLFDYNFLQFHQKQLHLNQALAKLNWYLERSHTSRVNPKKMFYLLHVLVHVHQALYSRWMLHFTNKIVHVVRQQNLKRWMSKWFVLVNVPSRALLNESRNVSATRVTQPHLKTNLKLALKIVNSRTRWKKRTTR